MLFDDFDLIENNKGELVAINCETSSVEHFEIFTATRLPSPPKVDIRPYNDTFIVKMLIHLPAKDTTLSVEWTAPQTLRGPAGIPDVSDIAMSLSGKPTITAVKFRGKWIACWNVP